MYHTLRDAFFETESTLEWRRKEIYLSTDSPENIQVMQETAELKERLERERADLESRLRQQADVQHERATELDKQVHLL